MIPKYVYLKKIVSNVKEKLFIYKIQMNGAFSKASGVSL